MGKCGGKHNWKGQKAAIQWRHTLSMQRLVTKGNSNLFEHSNKKNKCLVSCRKCGRERIMVKLILM